VAWLVVLLVLTSCGAPFENAVTAQAPRPADLGVDGVVVLSPGPRWIFDEARTARVRATVFNAGELASGYQLVFQWTNGATTRFLNEDALHSTDTSDQGPLGGNDLRIHEITWRPQSDEVGPGRILVSVQAPGGGAPDGNSANDRSSGVGNVPRWAARLNATAQTPPLHRGETGFMDVLVINEGTEPMSADLVLADANVGNRSRLSSVIEPANVTVAAGATGRATIFLTPPADARDESVFVANFSLRALTSFGRTLTVATPNVTNARGLAPTNQSFAVEEPPGGVRFVGSGHSTTVLLEVTNTAEQDDTYRVAAEPDGGWSAATSASHFGLHPGAARVVAITVESGFLASGTMGTVRAHVRSEHGRAAWSTDLLFKVSGASISWGPIRPLPAEWYVGEPAAVEVEVRNEGDIMPSENGSVRVAVQPPNATTTHDASLAARPAPKAAAKVRATVPGFAEGGVAHINVGWTGPVDAAPPPPASATVFVHQPELVVLAPTTSGLGVAGEGVAYRQPPRSFRVTNVGNAPETILVEARAEMGVARIEDSQSTFLLPVGASRLVPVVHELPTSTGIARWDNVTLVASIDQHPQFEWSATKKTLIEDKLAPVLVWSANASSLWTLDQPLQMRLAASDAASVVNATMRVTRPDATTETVVMAAADAGVWTGPIKTSWAGNYTIRAWAGDAFGNVGAATARRLEVRAIPLPTVAFLRPLDGANVTRNDMVRILLGPAGMPLTVILTCTPLESGQALQFTAQNATLAANFTLPAMPSGRWQFHVHAFNAHGGAREAVVDVMVPIPPAGPTSDGPGRPLAKPTDAPGPGMPALLLLVGLMLLLRVRPSHRR
jgi:hypothetical protein